MKVGQIYSLKLRTQLLDEANMLTPFIKMTHIPHQNRYIAYLN